jgi:hypothetical protein
MSESEFNPLHRFFYGDYVNGSQNMYSTSVGDTWLFFHDNNFVGVCHLDVTTEENEVFYVYEGACPVAQKAMREDISTVSPIPVSLDDLVGHALRFIATEISDLIKTRLVPNLNQ